MLDHGTNKHPVVEAVPNFSEGRRMDVVDQIAEAIQVPGVRLLNRTSDWDHNRTVLTVAGTPSAVVEGLFCAIGVAGELINLFEQKGTHPRLGATDVVPLVPIHHCTLDECITWARELGERVGSELGLPVYLYEAAATQPRRRNLEDIRRGQFEQLVKEIDNPERRPDYGPAAVGPAGAVIIGARRFLIAYNVFLKTADVQIAKLIAKELRESGGGLPAVKALGMKVDGRAQVSMNLVDFKQTGLSTVMERIAQLANNYHTEIDSSELIGLMPLEALLDAAVHYLRLPGLFPNQIVEFAMPDCSS